MYAPGKVFAVAAVVVVAGCGDARDTRAFTIPSSAMEPTLHCAKPKPGCEGATDNRVVVESTPPSALKRGDIVIFSPRPLAAVKCGVGGTFVKRIIGLPGDRVEVRKLLSGGIGEGYVFINGRKLKEPYIQEVRRLYASRFGPVTMSKDNYFMVGDNRSQSCDSRFWGSVPGENIVGKVTKIIRD